MPRFDGTGPIGHGTMTGRGRGYCAVRIADNYNFYPIVNPIGCMPIQRVYPNSGFQMRRFYPFGGYGRGFAYRRWL